MKNSEEKLNELTTKEQKEAYQHAIDSSLQHLKRELKSDIRRTEKKHGSQIVNKILKHHLKEAEEEFNNLGVEYSVLTNRMAYRCIDREAREKIMNAADGTYHNIFKWIDPDNKSKPEIDKVFRGWVLFKFIEYLKNYKAEKYLSDECISDLEKLAAEKPDLGINDFFIAAHSQFPSCRKNIKDKNISYSTLRNKTKEVRPDIYYRNKERRK